MENNDSQNNGQGLNNDSSKKIVKLNIPKMKLVPPPPPPPKPKSENK
jgi:hypothetical protein